MSVSLLPSEIARLILNYLEEENFQKTYWTFLDECKYLTECKEYLSRGIGIPKSIHGKTLSEYLVIESKDIDPRSTSSVSTQTEYEIEPRTFHQSPGGCRLPPPTGTLPAKPNELQSETNPGSDVEFEDDERTADGSFQTSNKRKRILVGKNVEKLPQFSVSVLERQLDSIINDPANHITSSPPPPETTSSVNPTTSLQPIAPLNPTNTDSSIFLIPMGSSGSGLVQSAQQQQPLIFNQPLTRFTTPAGTFLIPASSTPPVIASSPGPHIIGAPPAGLLPARIMPISQVPITVPINNIGKTSDVLKERTHFTNAPAKASSSLLETFKDKPGVQATVDSRQQSKPISTPKPDAKKCDESKPKRATPGSDGVKKQRVYNRITPTIRAIFGNHGPESQEATSLDKKKTEKNSQSPADKKPDNDIFDHLELLYGKADKSFEKSCDGFGEAQDDRNRGLVLFGSNNPSDEELSIDDILMKEMEKKYSKDKLTFKGTINNLKRELIEFDDEASERNDEDSKSNPNKKLAYSRNRPSFGDENIN